MIKKAVSTHVETAFLILRAEHRQADHAAIGCTSNAGEDESRAFRQCPDSRQVAPVSLRIHTAAEHVPVRHLEAAKVRPQRFRFIDELLAQYGREEFLRAHG